MTVHIGGADQELCIFESIVERLGRSRIGFLESGDRVFDCFGGRVIDRGRDRGCRQGDQCS
jgi:hypothetical protein